MSAHTYYWQTLQGAMRQFEGVDDEQLPGTLISAFSYLIGSPVHFEPVSPGRGMAFEISDGGELFGHIVCEATQPTEDMLEAGAILARYAAARFEAARLRQEGREFRRLIDAADVAITVADTHRRTRYGNAGMRRLLGYTAEELNIIPPAQRIHAEDLPRVEEARAANLRGLPTRIRWRLIRKNGSVTWLESYSRPLLFPNGTVNRLVVSTHNIDELMQSSFAARRLEDNFRSSAGAAGGAAFHVTLLPDDSLQLVWFGAGDPTLELKPSLDSMHPDDRARLDEVVKQLRAGLPVAWDFHYQSADGEYRPVRVYARASGVERGHFLVAGWAIDLSGVRGDVSVP